MRDPKDKRYFLDDPRNVSRLFWGFAALCLGLLATDLFYTKKALFFWEGWFGFESFYGFVGVALIVFGAIALRKIVMRPEDYYERKDDEH
jgi:hypothetical protein